MHFYHIEYKGEKILGVLGIEPRSEVVNHIDNEKLFDATIKAIIKEAKRLKYDIVGLPVNATMHSNRGKIGTLISELIRNKTHLSIDIRFPNSHSSTTNGIRVIWKRN